ncbi:MAG: AAA family ATPase, partial [Anaerolineales bacterium]|nr:AAA family ATPase [Anaerolineales bacterium]
QERAVAALQFGISIQQKGYNLFAAGPNGTGKYTAVRRYLEQKAAELDPPSDWCYIHNFDHSHQPSALELPAGWGSKLAADMETLLEELFTVIPTSFESEEYQVQKQTIVSEVQEKQENALEELSEQAQQEQIALVRTPSGFAFAPVKDGKTISPQQFQELPEEEQEKIQETILELQKNLQKILRQVPQWNQESRDRLKELNREVISFALSPLLEKLLEKYADFENVQTFLKRVQQDITHNIDKFIGGGAQAEGAMAMMAAAAAGMAGAEANPSPEMPFFNRYKVNVLVDHSKSQGAPVVYEDLPTHQNLVGRLEHISQMGALITNFMLIKPGALHRANGGYLILDVRKVLTQPYAWESLKRALRAACLHIESLGQTLSMISTVSLEPEPIPLKVKVVLLGERMLYYMLYQSDPEFGELFKVVADFEEVMLRGGEHDEDYAELLTALIQKNELRHFSRDAVARMIEYSSRLAADAERLSVHMQPIVDLLREASYWADQAQNGLVQPADVEQALEAQKYRHGRMQQQMQEMILRETVLIDTSGEQVGQINGLAVLQMGNHMFGRPNRITAQVRLGKGEVIDIERQVEMGGPLHSKGVLILTGFLGGRYAAERPLSLSASLVFEQSYSGVDGDSASSAELYALISALADVPIKQALAVTGSVNQHGEVQAIGGVNEKIEGFFDICQNRGLTGEQGVLIPAANVKNLMLRQDVVAAAEAGEFHIYSVTTIDQGIEILTGVPAGEADEEGNYPEGTINERVVQRLKKLQEKARAMNQAPAEEQKNE